MYCQLAEEKQLQKHGGDSLKFPPRQWSRSHFQVPHAHKFAFGRWNPKFLKLVRGGTRIISFAAHVHEAQIFAGPGLGSTSLNYKL